MYNDRQQKSDVRRSELPGRVNKDRHLGQNPAHVAALLDAFALAVVEILADQLIARPADLRLLVVAIEDKAPPRIGGVRDQIAVLVKGVALPGCKAVRVRVDRRVGKVRLRDLRRTDEFVVAQPIAITVIGKPLFPRPRAVLRLLRVDEPVKRVVFVPCYEGLWKPVKRKRLPGDVPGVLACINRAIRKSTRSARHQL